MIYVRFTSISAVSPEGHYVLVTGISFCSYYLAFSTNLILIANLLNKKNSCDLFSKKLDKRNEDIKNTKSLQCCYDDVILIEELIKDY